MKVQGHLFNSSCSSFIQVHKVFDAQICISLPLHPSKHFLSTNCLFGCPLQPSHATIILLCLLLDGALVCLLTRQESEPSAVVCRVGWTESNVTLAFICRVAGKGVRLATVSNLFLFPLYHFPSHFPRECEYDIEASVLLGILPCICKPNCPLVRISILRGEGAQHHILDNTRTRTSIC